MPTLHITNGDTAEPGIRAVDPGGEILPWRDVLHEGPVPGGLGLAELSRVRARFIAGQGMGENDEIERSFAGRDDILRRFTDFDEVVLWFEWDLYDQLQLMQVLDFLASHGGAAGADTRTGLSIVSLAGYLGTTPIPAFEFLHEKRSPVTGAMLELGRKAWAAFRSGDPRQIESIAHGDCPALEFLSAALVRQLEELPATDNGLARSERQILKAVSQGALSFSEIFARTCDMEERIYCGDATVARYIERMSRHPTPLLVHPTGELIDAPRTAEDSRAFRNSEIALTPAGRDVLRCDRDWIAMGGSDRWIGGIHLDGSAVRWRWDRTSMRVVAVEQAA
jgi:hypothetical protein